MRLRQSLSLLVLTVLCACGSTGPATMSFVSVTPPQPRIGDVVTVTFVLTDDRGLPLAGQDVNFKLQSDNPGVDLSPKVFTSLKGSGIATTQLQVKSRVTSVIVVATAGGKTVYSPPISVAGSVPNGKQFTFQCGAIAGDASGGRHAIGAYDATRGLIAGEKIQCTAHTGDRNGDGIPDALVSFMTEAGTIGPTEVSLTNVVGNATILYKTSYPLPSDVDPARFVWTPQNDTTHTGDYVAPTWMEPFMWIANPLQFPRPTSATGQEPSRFDPLRKKPDGTQYRNNPRDGLVTMIAVTSGEEGFTDSNNNGVWDTNEPFDDLTEPFVDANDNGTWDADERFIDVNGNHLWDGKNSTWDSNTLIWTTEKLLWTGIPQAPYDTEGSGATVKVITPVGNVHLCCFNGSSNPALYCGAPGGTKCDQAVDANNQATVDYVVYVADPWFNTLAQNGDGDSCSLGQVENSPVIPSLNKAFAGTRMTYPAGTFIDVSVKDKRDPNIAQGGSGQNPPKRFPPIVFTQPIICTFTSSPIGGNTVNLDVGAVTGDIE